MVVDFPEDIIKEIDENGRDKKFVKEIEGQEEAIKFNPKNEIILADAKMINKKIIVGEELVTDLEIPADFGRMAAQTAKQVIIQKIREAERETIYNEYKQREGQLVTGVIHRREMVGILVDMGKVTALMPYEEQIKTERYNPGERMKFYLLRVEMTIKGPEIIISRSSPEMIRKLFDSEIPEINSGTIEIMSIAREAGWRSKVAVKSNQENIDPIGSCVGQRGARIQTIISELGGEKIDIIEWDEDPGKFISNALSPAKVLAIDISEKDKSAAVTVNEDQLSLAIGKEGQNVRLAAKLTGWKINVIKEIFSGEKQKVELEADKEVSSSLASAKTGEATEAKEAGTEEKKVKKVKKSTSASASAKATADKKATEGKEKKPKKSVSEEKVKKAKEGKEKAVEVQIEEAKPEEAKTEE
jgi:N utilization substance protein A